MRKSVILSAVAVIAVFAFLCAPAGPAAAAVYYWDVNGTETGFGSGAGIWGTNAFWTLTATGGTPHSGVTSTVAGDDVHFGTATDGYTGAVTLSGTITAKSITFGSASGAVSLSGTFTLSANTIITNNNTTDTITLGAVSASNKSLTFLGNGNTMVGKLTLGSSGLTKDGTGTLTLTSGTSAYTGVTNIVAGTLAARELFNANTNSSIGRGNIAATHLLIGDGATLKYYGDVLIPNGHSTDRLFTLNGGDTSPSTHTLDASGAGGAAIKFTNPGSLAYGTTGNMRTLILTGNNTGGNTLAALLANNGAGLLDVVKNGTGTWTLSGANTYTGNTTISNGTLKLGLGSSSNNIASSVVIDIATGAYLDTTGLLNATLVLASGQTLKGSGTVTGALTVASGSTISPGNSPGTLTTGAETWAGDGTYVWEINDATAAAAGTNPGWDLLSGTGALTITATSGSKFNIDVTSLTLANVAGDAANFNPSTNYAWLAADFANPITGFDATAFNVDTTGFLNAFTGTFGVALGGTGSVPGDNSQVYVTYVPEPATMALLAFGGLMVLRRRRVRRA